MNKEDTMKKKILTIFMILFLVILLYSDRRITRGPNIGEIYYIGPTATQPAAIYHSTDFGQTAACMDSTLDTNINISYITADLTPGVLYGATTGEALYISYDYGQEDSWIYRNNISYMMSSGVLEGYIYGDIFKHSENYGFDFSQHACNGFSGNVISTEIDNQPDICYANILFSGIIDSLFLFISYDNYENIELQQAFNTDDMRLYDLSRGTAYGELYNFAGNPRTLYHSTDFGLTWQYMNEFNTRPDYFHLSYSDMVGGRQPGEVYILANYIAELSTILHTYIFHSTDYGRTFTVHHLLSVGEEQLLANFSASVREGDAPFAVQFSNYSVGEITSYEWDFNNDGIIDSTEPEPEYTYQDTGYYSVKLIIHSENDTNEFLREDFIYVTDGSGIEEETILSPIDSIQLSNYPNPFNPSTTIQFSGENLAENQPITLEIYNIKGQKIRQFNIQNSKFNINEVVWDGTDSTNNSVSSGIYFYKLNVKNSPIRKMILLK
jgi:PKD repeat protein